MPEKRVSAIIEQRRALIAHIMKRLHEGAMRGRIFPKGAVQDQGTACVLFLMGQHRSQEGMEEPCIVFKIAFSFRPPDMNLLPVIQGTLSREYLKGAQEPEPRD